MEQTTEEGENLIEFLIAWCWICEVLLVIVLVAI